MEKSKTGTKKVPPDGGWGWFIVIGSCLINISTVSFGPSFGLLFGDLLKQLGVETTGASLVLSTYEGVMNFSGIIVGPVIKKYSYRKVAIAGAVLCSAAFLLTAPANSMPHIIVTYGVLGGLGYGLVGSCWIVGINAYFSKRKGQALGLAMTGTVVGHMLAPHVVRLIGRGCCVSTNVAYQCIMRKGIFIEYLTHRIGSGAPFYIPSEGRHGQGFFILRILLDEYDFRSTLFLIGAISLHAIVGACLFQPVSWHMKAVKSDTEVPLLPFDKIENRSGSSPLETKNGVRRNDVLSNPNLKGRQNFINTPSEAMYGKESPISKVSLLDKAGNALHIQGKTEEEFDKELEKITEDISHTDGSRINNKRTDTTKNKIPKSVKSQLSRFSEFMDFEILTDGAYLNILYGISLFIATELNSRLIIPFFLSDLGFTKSEIAYALSSMAVTDIFARLVVPPIFDRITVPRRAVFLCAIVSSALGRSCLALLTTRGPIITAFFVIGFFRGISYASYPVVLAEYSCGSNFPSVLGYSMVSRGIFIVVFLPLSGYIRDVTNSYPVFIHCQTILTTSILIAWVAEMIILKSKRKREAVKNNDLHEETEDKIILTNA